MLYRNFQSTPSRPRERDSVALSVFRGLLLAFAATVTTASWAPDAVAADYHFCDCQPGAHATCQAGSDTSSLGTEAKPWRSMEIARTRFQAMGPGDSIKFCRGGRFSAQGLSTDWDNPRCRADNRCRIEDYTPPNATSELPRPVIHRPDGGMFNFNEKRGPATRGVTIARVDFVCSPCSGGGQGIRVGAGAGDMTFDEITVDGFTVNFYIKNDGAAQSNITVKNSRILNGRRQGFLGGSPNLKIIDNYFENNGGEKHLYDHSIYVSGDTDDSAPKIPYNILIRGNEVYKTSQVDGSCMGTAIVAHGYVNGLTIEENYIHEDPGTANSKCYGISVSPGYPSSEKLQNVILRRNVISNAGRVGILLGAIRNVLIENNIISSITPIPSQIGVYVKDRDEPGGFTNENVTIRNNSIFLGDSDHSRGVQLEGKARGTILANNAIYIGNGGPRAYCFRLQAQNLAQMENNLCFLEGDNGTQWVSSAGSLASWQSASGFDQKSIVGIEPGFRMPSAADLRASSADSPLVGTGAGPLAASDSMPDCTLAQHRWVGSCSAAPLRNANPDIGAYQQNASTAGATPPAAPILLPMESSN